MSASFVDLDLPPLDDEPERYPDFCLSLSNPLIYFLTNIFTEAAQKSSLVLSVGSGSGLLEAHLQARWSSNPNCELFIQGVEVYTGDNARPVNKYLAEQNCSTVKATWQLSSELNAAGALLFVYPRDTDLVLRYLKAVQDQENSPLQAVVWLGPRADYSTFADCLQVALDTGLRNNMGFGTVHILESPSLAEYEMMAAIKRKTM